VARTPPRAPRPAGRHEGGCRRPPPWFGKLNRDFRYLLTAIGRAASDLYISKGISGNRFSIAGGMAGQQVSWQVTGIRQDAYAEAHRIVVDEAKPAADRGFYLHPKLYGKPEEKGLDYRHRPRELRQSARLSDGGSHRSSLEGRLMPASAVRARISTSSHLALRDELDEDEENRYEGRHKSKDIPTKKALVRSNKPRTAPPAIPPISAPMIVIPNTASAPGGHSAAKQGQERDKQSDSDPRPDPPVREHHQRGIWPQQRAQDEEEP
jgi:hypothetical protein